MVTDWEGDIRDGHNNAVEDAHDYAWSGWRDLAWVPRRLHFLLPLCDAAQNDPSVNGSEFPEQQPAFEALEHAPNWATSCAICPSWRITKCATPTLVPC